MELVNATRKAIDSGCGPSDPAVREAVEAVAISLSLVAPYTAEDMWQRLGHEPLIAHAGWPNVDESLLGTDLVTAVLQINGKIRDRVEVSPDISENELEEIALQNPSIKSELEQNAAVPIKKIIVRAPKLVNIVI